MTRPFRTAPWLALTLLLACGESNEPTPPGAESGILRLTLQGAGANLAGVSIRVIAPGMDTSTVAFTAGAAHLLRVGGDTLAVALFGELGNTQLLTIEVADARDLSAFGATVVEALAPDNELLPAAQFSVTIQRLP